MGFSGAVAGACTYALSYARVWLATLSEKKRAKSELCACGIELPKSRTPQLEFRTRKHSRCGIRLSACNYILSVVPSRPVPHAQVQQLQPGLVIAHMGGNVMSTTSCARRTVLKDADSLRTDGILGYYCSPF